MPAMLWARLGLAPCLLAPAPSPPSSALSVRPPLSPAAGGTRLVAPRAAATAVSAKPAKAAPLSADRTAVRLGIASKGRMSDLTRDLLKSCQLTVIQSKPRQYIADIPQMPNLEVWLQRPTDIVRKLGQGYWQRQLAGEFLLRQLPIVVGETVLVCRRTPDGEPVALRLVVGAADVEACVLRHKRRTAGDDQALVAVRRPRPPPLEGRADEREDLIHCRRRPPAWSSWLADRAAGDDAISWLFS